MFLAPENHYGQNVTDSQEFLRLYTDSPVQDEHAVQSS